VPISQGAFAIVAEPTSALLQFPVVDVTIAVLGLPAGESSLEISYGVD